MKKMTYRMLAILVIFIVSLNVGDIVSAAEAGTPIFQTTTNIKNPLELRDPFKRKLNKLKKRTRVSVLDTLTRGNPNDDLLQVAIEQVRVVGVIIGPERRAIIKILPEQENQDGSTVQMMSNNEGEDQKTYFIKEGTRIGSDDSEVKAILPGGIVIVNRIKNVYDQDEYLETVIPITED